MTTIPDEIWWADRAAEAIRAGQHIPRDWNVEYDDGADGCMPAGW